MHIKCSSCSGSNQLPDGRSSMFCAFCGTAIQLPKEPINPNDNPLKVKPEVSQPSYSYEEGEVSGTLSASIYHGTSKMPHASRRRAEGGFEYFNGYNWQFVSDVKVVDDPGGELSLIGKNITNFNQISQWFSGSELDKITRLVLTNNSISSFDGVQLFRNVRELNLSSNGFRASALKGGTNISFIDTVVLQGNPIESELSSVDTLPSNITFNILEPCFECGYNRTQVEKKSFGKICRSCYANLKDKEERQKTMDTILHDPLMRKAFAGHQKEWYVQLYDAMGMKGIAIALVVLFFLGYTVVNRISGKTNGTSETNMTDTTSVRTSNDHAINTQSNNVIPTEATPATEPVNPSQATSSNTQLDEPVKQVEEVKNQQNEPTSPNEQIFQVVEQMPQFQGGQDELTKYLANAITYPPIAKENDIEGTIYVQFVVNKQGSITDIKVARRVDKYLDNEAIRVVSSMPKWIAGKQNGKNVSVYCTVPIRFNLP